MLLRWVLTVLGPTTRAAAISGPDSSWASRRNTARSRSVSGSIRAGTSGPGVAGAAYISYLPMVMRGGIWAIEAFGQEERSGDRIASIRYVTPGFFSTS